MKKIILSIVGVIVLLVLVVMLAGMYKFNYLASKPGYDADGNLVSDQADSTSQEETDELDPATQSALVVEENIDEQTESEVIESVEQEVEAEASTPQVSSWDLCSGLFPYTGNQGNSTFIDTTAAANLHTTGNKDSVSNGYEVRGCIQQIGESYDNWAPFEGQIGTYQLRDTSGSIITAGILSAIVTTNQTSVLDAAIAGENLAFVEAVNFDFSPYTGQTGFLELKNSNPSGEAQNNRTVQYQVIFN